MEAKEPSPRPWTQNNLLILDAKGREAVHCGGAVRDPHVAEANAKLIVRSVNSAELITEAVALLKRADEKLHQLVRQTGGEYESGELVQFLYSDMEKFNNKVTVVLG